MPFQIFFQNNYTLTNLLKFLWVIKKIHDKKKWGGDEEDFRKGTNKN
jgi:hypothetical protein